MGREYYQSGQWQAEGVVILQALDESQGDSGYSPESILRVIGSNKSLPGQMVTLLEIAFPRLPCSQEVAPLTRS